MVKVSALRICEETPEGERCRKMEREEVAALNTAFYKAMGTLHFDVEGSVENFRLKVNDREYREPSLYGGKKTASLSWSQWANVNDVLNEVMDYLDIQASIRTMEGYVRRGNVGWRKMMGEDGWVKCDRHLKAAGTRLALGINDGSYERIYDQTEKCYESVDTEEVKRAVSKAIGSYDPRRY